MKHTVRVTLVARHEVDIEVERGEDECPCDLDENEKARAIRDAWGSPEWFVKSVKEVQESQSSPELKEFIRSLPRAKP
jgi:hypothetical protein